MTATHSAIYVGKVMHQRLRPRKHRLAYNMFLFLLDLDEIDRLAQRLRIFSRNRFNLASFFDRDHGDGSGVSLREHVEAKLRDAKLDIGGGAIRLLTMPRVLGYVFNPLTVFFCHRPDGTLAAILYEVHNTFGQRHEYLLPVETIHPGGLVDQQCQKLFYVSPFMGMDIRYRFRVRAPDENLSIHITGRDQQGPLLIAALSGERREFTDASLARVLLALPLLTFKVIAGIHWEALLLWLKGTGLHERPEARPPSSATGGKIVATPEG